jgi:methionyl aminopeptidase
MMMSSLSIFATFLLSLSCGSSHAFVLVRPSVKTTFSTITTLLEMHNKRAKKKPNRSMKPKGGFAGALRDLQTATFDYAGTVKPGKTSPQKIVLQDGISIPDYAQDGMPKNKSIMLPWVIEVKTPEEIEKMKVSGRIARQVLDIAGQAVRVGMTTDEIDELVHEETLKRGAYPSPLNYHGFPKSCCTSVNEVICHGIPDDRPLQNGDIINIDITCYKDGYHGDCSEMFVVGKCDEAALQLLQTTYDCWIQACEFVKPGRDYKDIGAIIEDYVVPKGYSTVRNFCGHGIGSVFHTNPNIYHYRNNEPNGQMAPGHTFTIEPMICEGSAKPLTWPDEWTATTIDGKRSAQFEHTLLVTKNGVEALTGKLETSPLQVWERNSKIHKGFWLGNTPEARERAEKLTEMALEREAQESMEDNNTVEEKQATK